MDNNEQYELELKLKKAHVLKAHLGELKLALKYIKECNCVVTLFVDRLVGGRNAVPKLSIHGGHPDAVHDLPMATKTDDVVTLLENRIAILELHYAQL